jgi:phosphoglycerate dehydrogenase-like enzyme
MPKVVFFSFLKDELSALITAHAPADYEVEIHPADLPETQKTTLVADADFLLLFPGRLEAPVLEAASPKLIQLVSAGFEHMDLEQCRRRGIPVANNGGTNSTDVAEHTLALVMGIYRRLIEMDHAVRSGSPHADSGETTYTIAGKRVGLVGLGHIGQKAARLFKAFGADIHYTDAVAAPEPILTELQAQRLELDELLRSCDIVSLHVPLNANTRNLIGPRELDLMRPNAVLVNTCRGGVIDEAALARTLAAQGILGAGLDVLETEPPAPDNPLLTLDNVLLTPHTAGVTRDTWDRRGRFVFDNMQRVWNGEEALARIEQ